MALAFDLTLDDYNDEDLSEILQDNELHIHSYANGSFKVAKRRTTSRRCKRTKSECVVQSEKYVQRQTSANEMRYPTSRRPRPTTLKFFAAPARPGPLVFLQHNAKGMAECNDQDQAEQEQIKKDCEKVESRLKESFSEETIKNNNVHPPEKNELHSSSEIAKARFLRKYYDFKSVEMLMFRKFSAMIYIVQLCRAAIENPDRTEYCYVDGELKEQTHIASFKFVPRHADEISLEINDPLHVYDQADDFWYEGINMRSGEKGVFPAYYAQSLYDDLDEISEYSVKEEMCEQFHLYFLGSVEVPYHKGNDILCQAMHKVAQSRRTTLHQQPPAYVCLSISSHGIKMVDQTQMKQIEKIPDRKHVERFSSSSQVKERTHFFQLRNVSFCGHHPRNDKYFAFITRHPNIATRFACHVFVSESSTRPLAECVGRAFDSFYREYMECAHPTEDIYIE